MTLAESDAPVSSDPSVIAAEDPEDLRVTAYHEAGHAVAAIVIEGGTVDEATIVPSAERQSVGHVASRTRVFGWEHVIAGPLAGAMSMWLDGEVWLQLEEDFLIDGMWMVLPDHCDVAKIIGRWVRDAVTHERAHRNSGLVFAPEPVRPLVEFELECVTMELCANWPAVEAVAAALLEHRTLDGDQVAELIASTPKRHPWRRKNSRARREMVKYFREIVPPLIGQSIVSLRKRGTTFADPLLARK